MHVSCTHLDGLHQNGTRRGESEKRDYGTSIFVLYNEIKIYLRTIYFLSSMLRIKLYMVCTLVVVLISINIYTRSKLHTRHGTREAKFKKEKNERNNLFVI